MEPALGQVEQHADNPVQFLGGQVLEGDPTDFAAPIARLLADPAAAHTMGIAAEARSRRYGWSMTAARLRRLYIDLLAREPVSCR